MALKRPRWQTTIAVVHVNDSSVEKERDRLRASRFHSHCCLLQCHGLHCHRSHTQRQCKWRQLKWWQQCKHHYSLFLSLYNAIVYEALFTWRQRKRQHCHFYTFLHSVTSFSTLPQNIVWHSTLILIEALQVFSFLLYCLSLVLKLLFFHQ